MDAAGIVDKTSQAKARQSTRQSAATVVIVIVIMIIMISIIVIMISMISILSNWSACSPIKAQMNASATVRSQKSEIERKVWDEISGGLKSWH